MKLDAGITTVTTAGTEVQISNTTNRVRWIKAKALAANSGITIEINFADVGGTIEFSTIYVDAATDGDKVSWAVVLDG